MRRVVIADEQPIVRHALRQLLGEMGHEVVAERDDGTDALQDCLRLLPDLLILDLALPRLSGLEVVRRLRQRESRIAILVLTAQSSEHFAGVCLQAGATGFVGKEEPLASLRDAISTLLRGHGYFPSQTLGTLAPTVVLLSEDAQLQSLSPRELSVLRYLAAGFGNKRIADELSLSDRTVSTYKARLQQKLNAGSLAELLEIAWRIGLAPALPSSHATGEKADIATQFHQLFGALPVPMAMRDATGRLLACNHEHLGFNGMTPEQAKGTLLTDVQALAPEDALRLHQGYLRAFSEQRSFSQEIEVQYLGRNKVLHVWGAPCHNQQGTLVGMLCSFVDRTEHEQDISTLVDAQQRRDVERRTAAHYLERSGECLAQRLAELDRLLQSFDQQAPSDQTLAQARLDIEDLQQQVRAMLDSVRCRYGHLPLRPQRTDLHLLTQQALGEFSEAQASRGRPATLQHRPSAHPALAWVDPARYRQLLEALLRHAAPLGPDAELRESLARAGHGRLRWTLDLSSTRADDDPLDIHGVLARRLALLMGGTLERSVSDAGIPSLHLELDLPLALPIA
ncbi:hypothetical protein TUM18999_03030 [Pseudomonas tohonis]|uniref:Response regulator n=1 Tax=Pseudomonas tohonis TaxID=2725477 RepID=A0A6J4DX89_9PSED|nr:response regulator [Pseudomonas tohonis]BCG22112.1 hypothetical protein TUM18999_03030 [Pseudomonas tohonis]